MTKIITLLLMTKGGLAFSCCPLVALRVIALLRTVQECVQKGVRKGRGIFGHEPQHYTMTYNGLKGLFFAFDRYRINIYRKRAS